LSEVWRGSRGEIWGVVGEVGVRDVEGGEKGEKGDGGGQEGVAVVEGAIKIEGRMGRNLWWMGESVNRWIGAKRARIGE
jgi:hypothetical protein